MVPCHENFHKGSPINQNILTRATAILDDLLGKRFYALDFNQTHYNALRQKLSEEFPDLDADEHKGAMKQGIANFFAHHHQSVILTILEDGIKLHKDFLYPERGESFDRLLHRNALLLHETKETLESFRVLPYLYTLPESFRSKLYELYPDDENKDELFRESTRSLVHGMYDLHERSIVLFLNKKIYLREFVPPKPLPSGADRRFSGQSEAEMKALYDQTFPEGAWQYIEPMIEGVLREDLNFAHISNKYFTANFVKVFSVMVDVILSEHLDKAAEEKAEGLCGYVLRIHFPQIMFHTAQNLLQHLQERHSNAEKFIKYFADESIIDASGKKVKKYAIEDKYGSTWNFSSLLSVMMQYKQFLNRQISQQLVINNAKDVVADTQKLYEAEREHLSARRETLDALDQEVRELGYEAEALQLKVKSDRQNQEASLNLTKLLKSIDEKLDAKKARSSEIKLIENKCENLGKELSRHEKKLNNEIRALQLVIEQGKEIQDKYELISNALAATLAKR